MPTNTQTLMLVEDNPDEELLTLRELHKNGYSGLVVVARDGVETLDILLSIAEVALPQVVLLDLNLPKLSGLEVLRQLRGHERTRRLPVVVFTSSCEDSDILTSYLLGANSFVQKPIDSAAFRMAVRQIAIYWMNLNAAA